MSNWKRWPDAPLNAQFADIEHPDRIVYPELRDRSPLILASSLRPTTPVNTPCPSSGFCLFS